MDVKIVADTMRIIIIIILISYSEHGRTEVLNERRIILDEGFSWLTAQGAEKTVADIKSAGFNVFVPCVWHGRGVTWASLIKEKEPLWVRKSPNEKDPLRYLVEIAHRNGIEVHPWFTVTLRPIDILGQFYDYGTPDKAFNVHNPDFRDFMVNSVLEVVRKYDIDGINLDYIRSMGVCTSALCVEDYKKYTNRDLFDDLSVINKNKSARIMIAKWNAKAIDEMVSRISLGARELKPGIIVSVSSHAGMEILKDQGADSIKWANNGLIDIILHIEYAERDEIRWDLITGALQKLKEPRKFVLMVGNYEKKLWGPVPRDPEKVSGLINISRGIQPKPWGVALYQYAYLTNEQISSLRDGPFR